MTKVIVVPETEDYALDVSHSDTVWVTKNLGTPRLVEHQVGYLAPLWLKEPVGVTRIYHILSVADAGHAPCVRIVVALFGRVACARQGVGRGETWRTIRKSVRHR